VTPTETRHLLLDALPLVLAYQFMRNKRGTYRLVERAPHLLSQALRRETITASTMYAGPNPRPSSPLPPGFRQPPPGFSALEIRARLRAAWALETVDRDGVDEGNDRGEVDAGIALGLVDAGLSPSGPISSHSTEEIIHA
jgi:hypothetical protein